MREKILTWLGGLFLVSILPILFFTTFNSGDDALAELAVEYEICANVADCTDEQKEVLAKLIIEGSEYSSLRQIKWCLGVDTWADTHVRRGGWVVGFMMDGGYLFCPTK